MRSRSNEFRRAVERLTAEQERRMPSFASCPLRARVNQRNAAMSAAERESLTEHIQCGPLQARPGAQQRQGNYDRSAPRLVCAPISTQAESRQKLRAVSTLQRARLQRADGPAGGSSTGQR